MSYIEIIDAISEKRIVDWDKVHEINAKAYKRLSETDTQTYHTLMQHLEKIAYSIDLERAKEIVNAMKPFGQCWSYEQVSDYVKEQGETEDFIDWYLVMNMVKNDYYKAASNYGLQNDPQFYYSIARDFIKDEDAEECKVGKYFS